MLLAVTKFFFLDINVEGAEVKKGSAASITCTVSNFRTKGVTVTWKETSGKVIDGTDSDLNGHHISVLSLSDVQSDASYMCVVRSKTYPGSESTEKTTELKTYGNYLTFITIKWLF